MGGQTPPVARARPLALGALVVAGSVGLAWCLAYPQGHVGPALVRSLADCAAVGTLGLAVVGLLDTGRHRDELTNRATGALAAASAVWVLAELTRLVGVAADAAAIPVSRLSLRESLEFALHTTAGRAGLLSIAAAALVCLLTLTMNRTVSISLAAAGASAAGLAARTIAGHLSDDAVGAIAVAVHALAAALWCGTLAALALTVRHRGQWARVLPRFSRMSALCVAALLGAGTVAAVVVLDSPARLYDSGYGRVLLAKMILMAVLLAIAWRNRTRWLPEASAHRVSAEASRSRSLTELAIMSAALAVAAALAVTG